MQNNFRARYLETSGDSYDDHVGQKPWGAYMTKREQPILKRIVNNLFPNKIPRYLDFACGSGRHTQLFEPLSECSYGVDVSESMLKVARKKCSSTTFFCQDITQEMLAVEPVNVVSSFRFFGNAEDSLRHAALRAINHLLLPDGYLIFNNHENPNAPKNAISRMINKRQKQDLSHSLMKRLLREAGFEVRANYGIGAWFVHSSLHKRFIFQSRFTTGLELLSRIPMLVPFCPDAIIVAQKVSEPYAHTQN